MIWNQKVRLIEKNIEWSKERKRMEKKVEKDEITMMVRRVRSGIRNSFEIIRVLLERPTIENHQLTLTLMTIT